MLDMNILYSLIARPYVGEESSKVVSSLPSSFAMYLLSHNRFGLVKGVSHDCFLCTLLINQDTTYILHLAEPLR